MSWAKDHDRCKSCGTEEHKHKARGLCTVLLRRCCAETVQISRYTREEGIKQFLYAERRFGTEV